MNLVIHAGLHKTATSSFQIGCTNCHHALLRHNLYYPFDKTGQHWHVPAEAQARDYDALRTYLTEAKGKIDENGTILLSSENLENVLIQNHIAVDIEEIARDHGINEITWVFVTRNQFDYFESLYAEKSEHDVFLRYDVLACIILRKGYHCESNSKLDWYFVFDYDEKIAALNEAISSPAWSIEFKDFVKPFPGQVILDRYAPDACEAFAAFYSKQSQYFPRKKPEEVERLYLRNFIGAEIDESNLEYFKPMIDNRIQAITACRDKVKELFEQKYDQTVSRQGGGIRG